MVTSLENGPCPIVKAATNTVYTYEASRLEMVRLVVLTVN